MATIEKISALLPQLIGGSADLVVQIIQKQITQKLLIQKILMEIIFITELENTVWLRS